MYCDRYWTVDLDPNYPYYKFFFKDGFLRDWEWAILWKGMTLEFGLPVITATIDIDPDALNLKSRGKWVTAYIELPEGYDVADIDVSTVGLYEGGNLIAGAEPHPTEIGDYDDDGVPDLMVKFDRQVLIDYLKAQGYGDGDMVELTVTGEVAGTPFKGFDTIRVISKGKGS